MARPALEFSFPRLVVIFVLLSSRPRNLLSYLVFFTPTKRYQEVDGVRKEKERLPTDHQPQGNVRWLMVVNLCLLSSGINLAFGSREHLLPQGGVCLSGTFFLVRLPFPFPWIWDHFVQIKEPNP